MSKKPKAKGRGIPVDMSDFSEELGDHVSGAYVLPRASASGAPKALTLGDSFVLSSKPMSTKARIQAAEAEAAAAVAAAEAEAAQAKISDELYKEYMKMHQPPKSVTCALCKSVKPVSEAIAHKWKKHDFFANQAICDKCDTAHPLKVPKFVPGKPDMLSARQERLMKMLKHASAPPNRLKAKIAETAVFDLTPDQRMMSLHGMRDKLAAAFLTPPASHNPIVGHAEVIPFNKAQLAQLKKATYNRGGTRRTKSRSKSKSRSRSRF